MNTVSNDQWAVLVQSQMQRALAGDASACKWIAEHKPDATAPSGRAADVHREIASMTSDELRRFIADEIARLEACPHCGGNLRGHVEGEALLAGPEQGATDGS